MRIIFILLLATFFGQLSLPGQKINGRVFNEGSSNFISKASIVINGFSYNTDISGSFSITNEFSNDAKLNITIGKAGFSDYTIEIPNKSSGNIELGNVFLRSLDLNLNNDLKEDLLIENNDDETVGSFLSAAWDPFGSVADFNFSVTRFNPRGLDSDHSLVYLNNLPFQNLSDGRYFWNLWGGLNDMFRNRYSQYGMNSTDYSPGGFNGTLDFDLRARKQRAQTQGTFSVTNRTYQYRAMVSHNSGLSNKGWAYSCSLSRRWGNGGFVQGTYYDAYSYFASIDKVINEKNALSLTVFAAPTTRGRASGTTQFVYDLVGDNFYNPNWGFQNGEVRNSREFRSHQPVAMLRHDLNINDRTTITTSIGFQTGKNGSTRLGWLEAADPRPDYYANLPYDNRLTLSDSDLAELTLAFQNDPSVNQVNWDQLIEINQNRQYIIPSATETTTENISAYIVEEQRFDNDKFVIQSNINSQLGSQASFQGGISFQYDRNHQFKVVDDLLGGSYYLDIDAFALRDSLDFQFIQNDIERPNRLLSEGDVFGYEHFIHIQKGQLWSNLNFSKRRFDFTVNMLLDYTRFWREGLVANGKFPEFSKGNSEKSDFVTGMVKAGVTYKINNRNYLYGKLGYTTRAPFARFSFLSSQTRNQVVPNLTTEKVYAGEIGYLWRLPRLNARASAFYYDTNDRLFSSAFFLDNIGNEAGRFVNINLTNIDRINYGVELGAEYSLTNNLQLKFAAAIGEYYINSRPTITLTIDNSAENALGEGTTTAYLENFNVAGVPQVATSIGLGYRTNSDWTFNINANYFQDIYIDPNPNLRTVSTTESIEAITGVRGFEGESREDIREDLVSQERYDSGLTVDVFIRKSIRFSHGRLNLSLGINNILDNREFRIGGFEQFRFDSDNLDPNRWAPRYFYAFGRTFNATASYRF